MTAETIKGEELIFFLEGIMDRTTQGKVTQASGLVRVFEAARYVGVNPTTIAYWIKRGYVLGYRSPIRRLAWSISTRLFHTSSDAAYADKSGALLGADAAT